MMANKHLAKKKRNLKAMGRRGLSLFLAMVMTVSLIQIGVSAESAADTQAAKQISSQWDGGSVYYKADGTEGSSSDWAVKLSRTLTATGTENLFDVNMTVEVKDGETQIASKSAAVSLVLDTSGSMAKCSECGADSHRWPTDHTFTSRLSAAKEALVDFLNAYAKDSEGNYYSSPRMVSLVTYAGSATKWGLSSEHGNQYWINVANETNLNYVITSIIYGTESTNHGGTRDKIRATGGTNTDAGVGAAADLLNTTTYASQIGGISNRYCILLTDGEPTYNNRGLTPTGNGYYSYSGDTYGAQLSCQDVIDTGAELYSIAYGLSGATVPAKTTKNGNSTNVSVITKDENGNVTGGWLKDYCGSTAVYDASKSSDLIAAFNAILTQTNESSTSTSAVSTTVGLQQVGDSTRYYSFIGFLGESGLVMDEGVRANSYNGATQAGGIISWDLNNAESTHDDAAQKTTYTLSYRVRLDNTISDFKDWDTNSSDPAAEYNVGDATLTFTHTNLSGETTTPTVAFPTLKAHGYLAALELTKVAFHNTDLKLPGAIFQLDSTNHANLFWENAIHRESPSGTDGKVTFKDNNKETIPSGYTYTLTEKSAPEGYDVNAEYRVNVTVAYGVADTLSDANKTVKDKLTQTYQDQIITKTWAKPDSMSTQAITINVYRADVRSSDSSYNTPVLYGSFTANGARVTDKTGSLSDVTITGSVSADGPTWTYVLEDLELNIPETGGTWTYTITENALTGFAPEVSGLSVRNVASGETTVSVEKEWILPQGTVWPEVKVQLTRNGKPYGDEVTLNSDNNFTYTWGAGTDKLPMYDSDGQKYTYDVTESYDNSMYAQVSKTTNTSGAIVFTNTVRSDLTIDKEITKIWNDDNGEGRPDRIQVRLKQDGQPYGDPVTMTTGANGNVTVNGSSWSYTFEDLPRYKFTYVNNTPTAVEEYVYTVEEVGTIDGYTSESEGLTIENTRSASASITVTKEWDDDFNSHKNVTIELHQSSVNVADHVYRTLTIGASGNKSVTINDVPLYDGQGKTFTYTVAETDVLRGYQAPDYDYGTGNRKIVFTQNNDGSLSGSATVTNTLDDDDTTISYTINKTWEQPNGVPKPNLPVTLYQVDAEGNKTEYTTGAPFTVPGSTGTLTITGLPKYYYVQETETVTDPETNEETEELTGNVLEKEYSYYAEEDCPNGYTAKDPVEGTNSITFTNTITGKVKVTVNKSWVDSALTNPDHSGAVITVLRYVLNSQGGKDYDADWSKTWTVDGSSKDWTVDQYDGNGNRYFYEAEESSIPTGYSSSGGTVDEDTSENFEFSFVNTLNDNGTTHPVTKNWVDGGTADAKRPSITVRLNQGSKESAGTEFASVTVNGDGTYTVSSAQKNLAGAAYSNSDVSVTRNYSDNSNTWYIVFNNLPLYDNGRTTAYTYTATEDAVEGYDESVLSAKGVTTITNTLEQDNNINLGFTKSWVDPDGTEHPNVTFKLTATKPSASTDTKDYSQTVILGFGTGATQPTNEGASVTSNTWSYTFENLPKYTDDRYEITYSIQEITTLTDYEQSESARVFTNKLKQDYVSASLTKTWDNSYTGYLPEDQQPETVNSITVQLYRQVGETGQAEPVGNPIVLTVGQTDGLTVDETTGVWSYTYGVDANGKPTLEKYTETDRQVYTYFFREVYQLNNTYAQVGNSSTSAWTVNGREYRATYADGVTNSEFTTDITNTFQNPQKYYYQVIRTYETYVSGSIVDSRTEVVTGNVNTEDTSTTITVNAEDYLTYTKGGVTSDQFTFVQGRVNQNNGSATTEGTYQTSPNFSQNLTDPNVLYIFDLQYRLDLYKLNVNYVFTDGTKPTGEFQNYVDAGEYKAGDSYTANRLDAPDGYELYKVTLKDSDGAASEKDNLNFNSGIFPSHDVTVTYYYRRVFGNDVTDVNPTFTLLKVDDNKAPIKSGSAQFGIYSTADCSDSDLVTTISTDTATGSKTISASSLGVGTWYLKETASPDGYAIPENAPVWEITVGRSTEVKLENSQFVTHITWTMSVEAVGSDASALNSNNELVVTNQREYGYLTITKIVSGLKMNEEKTFQFTVSGNNYGTNYSNEKLSITVTGNGTQSLTAAVRVPTGTYQVLEDSNAAALNSYEIKTTYSDAAGIGSVTVTTDNTIDAPASITVTNAYTYHEISANLAVIPGTKIWNDDSNRDGLRPLSIRVQLFEGTNPIADKYVDVPSSGDGSFSISYDKYLHRGDITVKEVGYTDSEGYHEGIPTGYQAEDGTANNQYTVTNTHAPETVAIQAEKVWSSGKQQAVTFNLYADGQPVENATLTLDGVVDENGGPETAAWKGSFSGTFYKYADGGKLISYTVEEESLGNNWSYTVSQSGLATTAGYIFTVTNSYQSSNHNTTYYKVTVNYYDKETNSKIAQSHVSDPIRSGSRYDVTAYDAIIIEGYTYDSTTGDPLTGVMNGNKVVNVWYVADEEIPDVPVPGDETPDEPIVIPEEPTPGAEVPATGDNLMMWVMAAALSGIGLIWLTITGKKRKEDEI